MASATNWLSFSLSPIEMLRSSQSHQMLPATASAASQQSYFVDSFYGNDWASPRGHGLYAGEENHEQSIGDPCAYMEHTPHEAHPHPTIPKLEDFLGGGGDPVIVRYSDSQTENQEDSSLTHIYHDPNPPTHHHGGGGYFTDQQQQHHHHHDLKAIAAVTVGFQAFPANSGSEVDDSMSMSLGAQSQIVCVGDFVGHSFEMESAGSEMAVSQCPTEGLSLGVTAKRSENVIVAADQTMEPSKRIADTFGQRTSIYRGVTRHRWTGRYEAHLWDNSCRREGQARKGRQVYLGGYDKEDKAARAYDLAALKYWGPTATTNFLISNYAKEVEEMKHVTKQEFIASLRRKSSGFSRGASIYRGVTRHHQQGRWQARIGRVAGNKDLYLGTFATEEEAAEAYDIAAIKFRGMNAVTNFEMNRYDVEAIANSALPIGGAAKRLKLSLESVDQKPSLPHHDPHSQCNNGNNNINNNISFGNAVQHINTIPSGIPFDASTAAALYHHHNMYHHLHSNGVSAADPPGSVSAIAATSQMMSLLPQQQQQQQQEFFIWPHQSY